MPDANIIALHPLAFEVSTDAATRDLTEAMMAPVFTLAEEMQARFQAEGLPAYRRVRVTVRCSKALKAALATEGAFDVIVETDNG